MRAALLLVAAIAGGLLAIGLPQLSPAARPVHASALVPAALNGYATMKGQTQGDIKGGVTLASVQTERQT